MLLLRIYFAIVFIRLIKPWEFFNVPQIKVNPYIQRFHNVCHKTFLLERHFELWLLRDVIDNQITSEQHWT